MVMVVVCAWCGETLRTLSGAVIEGVSHGICRWCVKCWHAVVEPVEGDPWALWQDTGGEG